MSIRSRSIPTLATVLVLALVGCKGGVDTDDTDVDTATDTDTDTETAPTVDSFTPANEAISVHLDAPIGVTFSEAMDPDTLTATAFTLTYGDPAVLVPGVVTAIDATATFLPVADLAAATTFTVTVTTEAESARGVSLAADTRWTFTTATQPAIISVVPLDRAVDVVINAPVTATFTEPMDPLTIDDTTFLVTWGDPAISVPGTVLYAGTTASFWPGAHLPIDTEFTATLTSDATSRDGVALVRDYVWTFTTGDLSAPSLPVDLGTAAPFAVLAKSGVSTVPESSVTGDVGVSPAAATYITGFSLTADPSNVFSLSTQVVGRVYAADYAVPTPMNLTTSVGDMELALTDAAGRAPDVTELGAGDIGGMALVPGVYKWGTGLLIPTDVTLTGGATDVWIFQIAQDLTLSSGARVTLAGGALPENVFWQVSGLADLGTTAHLEGTILSQTAVTLHTGATVNGRLLAQTAVALQAATVVKPAH